MRIAVPSRSAIPSATLSSTGRLRKSVVIWNVRPRPRRTRADCGMCVTSSSTSRICPEEGASLPVSMLTNVVLPAPFGPMSAWRAPRWSWKSMLSATVSAPKLLHSFLVSKEYIENSEDSAPREEHYDDQQDPDAEVPILGILLGEVVLRDQVNDRSDERAIEAADAAEDQHDQDVARGLEAEDVQPDELVHLREQRTGDSRQDGRDGVDEHEPPVHRRADRLHARRVFADAGEHRPVWGIHDPAHHPPSDKQHHEAVEKGGPAIKIEAEQAQDLAHFHPGQSVGAARHGGPLVGDLEEDRRNREREHEHRERRRGDELHERIGRAGMRAERPGGISAQSKKRAVTERDDSGVAEDQVERQREQDEDQNPRAEREVARHQEEERDGGEPRQPLRPADPRVCAVAAHRVMPGLRTSLAVSTKEFLWWPHRRGTHQTLESSTCTPC